MPKKKVFVISHSHWDREWYLPFEHLHMRAVNLIDSVLDLIDRDPKFNSFHLDGQAIMIEDYLRVRPENETRVRKAISDGKLQIGPFYVLQDDFLSTPEIHVKDFQVGKQITDKFGEKVDVGYFPDTFGNMGQTPQMMKLIGLDAVAFGRGVKPTGLNNQVSDGEFDSSFSELNWQGPDNTNLTSILFANWYSNGNEIPVDKTEAKKFWDQKLADVEKFASTPNLLMMNGVDHQPAQTNISKALEVARELFPDYEFIHSNFDEYVAEVKKSLPNNLTTINGELTSQETDGWYTLTNTASSRMYLKQKGAEVVDLFTNQITPVAIANSKKDYPADQLNYAWKMILKNYIHDSITGCSIDPVHREMMTRFEKAEAVGDSLKEQVYGKFAANVNTAGFAADDIPFVVLNTSGAVRNDAFEVTVELDRALFKDGRPDAQFDRMETERAALKGIEIIDGGGNRINSKLLSTYTQFHAVYPDDSFRVPYMGLYAKVLIQVPNFAKFSWQTLALRKLNTEVNDKNLPENRVVKSDKVLENEYVKVALTPDTGDISILDKITGHKYNKSLYFEDSGDMGNEYIYKETTDSLRISSEHTPFNVTVITDTAFEGVVELEQVLNVPVSANELLDIEQKKVIDITKRKAKRSTETKELVLKLLITVSKGDRAVKFNLTYDNELKDHRLRAIFNTGISAKEHEAESVFEVVKRPNSTYKTWQNPENAQRQQAFVNIHNEERGVTIGNIGLPEYEVLNDGQEIALTLLRAVGEMGDWGYFATPEAQVQGKQHAEFSLLFHNEKLVDKLATYQEARALLTPITNQQTTIHDGEKAVSGEFLTVNSTDDAFAVTAMEMIDSQIVVRGYNMTQNLLELNVTANGNEAKKAVNFFGENYAVKTDEVGPAQILNLSFE